MFRARPAQISKITTPLLPLPKQRRIAAILDQADALRAKTRPMRKSVEKYAKPDACQKLGSHDFNELAKKVACLPTEMADEDEEDKRFDMLALCTQLAILQARTNFTSLRERIQTIAGALEEQEAIPVIKAQKPLIQAMAGD